MNWVKIAFIVLLSSALAFFVQKLTAPDVVIATPRTGTALERITKDGVLRCGYILSKPMAMKSVGSNEMSGFAVDFMNQLSAKAGFKTEWTKELTHKTWFDAIKNGDVDALCTPIWPHVSFYREIKFTRPVMWDDLYPIVRSNDVRFDGSQLSLNTSAITIAVRQDDSTAQLSKTVLPKANFKIYGPETDNETLYQLLVKNEYDVVLRDRNSANQFASLPQNVGSIRILQGKNDIGRIAYEFALDIKETDLVDLFNRFIKEMQGNNGIDALVKKWYGETGVPSYIPAPMELEPYFPFTVLDVGLPKAWKR